MPSNMDSDNRSGAVHARRVAKLLNDWLYDDSEAVANTMVRDIREEMASTLLRLDLGATSQFVDIPELYGLAMKQQVLLRKDLCLEPLDTSDQSRRARVLAKHPQDAQLRVMLRRWLVERNIRSKMRERYEMSMEEYATLRRRLGTQIEVSQVPATQVEIDEGAFVDILVPVEGTAAADNGSQALATQAETNKEAIVDTSVPAEDMDTTDDEADGEYVAWIRKHHRGGWDGWGNVIETHHRKERKLINHVQDELRPTNALAPELHGEENRGRGLGAHMRAFSSFDKELRQDVKVFQATQSPSGVCFTR
ncbi:hypothetical protein DOTSEDRAFT_39689 [Dothistroma septosporum NZE10]|uniref:Uncharacterized protein n=1 Tax=Dothistroma septosporum (strain NZE10 / CBS 128990) TaxID=675120 RepID=M2XZQ4_DOTSN|nr:hypothetical protein DOTSEDRAFT_39689 [Dothistroma septosporum NZE10]